MNKQEVNTQRYMLILAVLLIAGGLMYALRSVLLPFVVGIAVAYFLDPLVNRLTRGDRISRAAATSLVLAAFLLILLPLLILLGGMAVSQVSDFVVHLPEYVESFGEKVKVLIGRLQEYFPALIAEGKENLLAGNWGESLKPVVKVAQKIIANGFALVNLVSLLLISPVVAFYMLRDWHGFTGRILDLVPKKHKKNVVDGMQAVDRIISGYLRGQALVCAALGTFYSLGLWLVGLKLGVLVGFIAGLISFIPYVGSISGFLMAMVLVVTQYGTLPKIIAVVVVFLIGQFLEGNFLTPKFVGENIGLHPVWVMFALLAGGVLLGLLGMIIAVPVAAIIGVLLRFLIEHYKKSAIYLEK
ncbi:MAG: AI-2E family transporter [Alphaproteobacteria bacterium]|nr:AI-2E family transporter [Alphaproteobacteria bacterium]